MISEQKRVLIISFSDLSLDARLDRHIRFLMKDYQVIAAGYSAPRQPNIQFVELPRISPLPNSWGKLVRACWLMTRRYNTFYWNRPVIQDCLGRLRSVPADLILANDIETLPLALELGVGAGWHVWEASAYGYPFPDIGTRLDMLEEGVQIIRRMLTEERTTFSGVHYQVDNASCLPAPVQERLPIWIGGVGEKRTLKIVADHADGWNAAYLSPQEFARVNDVLNHWCEDEQRDPKTLKRAANIMFNLGLNESDLKKQNERLQADWGELAERTRDGALLCTPDQAVERILEYVEAGADEVNIALRAPWHAEALDAYLTDVMPKVRAAVA